MPGMFMFKFQWVECFIAGAGVKAGVKVKLPVTDNKHLHKHNIDEFGKLYCINF